MSNKTVIITGSNTGIGKEAAIGFLNQGARVIFACRDPSKALNTINSLDPLVQDKAFFLQLDISSFDSILAFSKEFKQKFSKFDILVNNAGATIDKYNLKEGIEATLMTNHVGHVVLTALLIKSLHDGGRIINVSSRGHKHVTENDLNNFFNNIHNKSYYSNNYGLLNQYCLSKLGNVYHAIHLANYFKEKNIQVKTASLHPGLVSTEIFSLYRYTSFFSKVVSVIGRPVLWLFAKDSKMGAQTTLHVGFLEYNELTSGAYFSNCRVEKLRSIPSNKELMEKFMIATRDLIYGNMKEIPEEVEEYFSIKK